MHNTWISLGSNLDNRIQNIDRAIIRLSHIEKTQLQQVSSYYETAPIGCGGNFFINVAMKLTTELNIVSFFNEMMKIESDLGRIRSFPNAPRTIDIDMLYYDSISFQSEKITIPHPRIEQRAFVLIPLNELNCPYVNSKKLAKVKNQTIKKLSNKFTIINLI